MHQKRLAAGLRPDPLGELKRSPRPPSRSREDNYSRSLVPIAGTGEGGMDVRGMGRDEMRGGILKPDIFSDFKFRSKRMFGAELRKESIERV